MKRAVAILSFNRPDYLKKVIDSVKEQTYTDFDYWLFQDGNLNQFSWRRAANQTDIDKCIEIFKEAFPKGKVEYSKTNIGIGLNWKRCEEQLFLEEEYEEVIFLEDDLVLSPPYMETMVNMFDQFRDDDRVGMINAYGEVGGNRFPEVGPPSLIRRMGHLWAIGVSKKQWLKRRKLMLEFYDIIGDKDYRFRPWQEIANFYAANGIKQDIALGQDGCKTAVLLLSKQVKVSPSVNLAKYIGEKGFHADPANYQMHQYGTMPVYDKVIKKFKFNDKIYNDIYKELSTKYLEK